MPFILKNNIVAIKQKAFLYLMQEFGYSQSESQSFIARGRLVCNGEVIQKAHQEIQGECELITFEPVTRGLFPHAVYDEFVVFDKPSGVLIHPQNRNTPYSLIDELKYQFGMDANIVHRIDQETSGLVLCARNKESERIIKCKFQDRDMKKKYLAFVHGKLENELTIDAPLLRYDDEKSALVRMVVKVDISGKESLTYVKPLEYFSNTNVTLVECTPHTGRQHQIRVHLFHMKHPIVGDPIYAQPEANIVKYLDRELSREDRVINTGATRLLLHANELEFELYGNNYHINSNTNFVEIARTCMQKELL